LPTAGVAGGEARLVAACFGRETATWTPEAEPIVLERLDAMVSSTAVRVARIGGHRVVAWERDPSLISRLHEGAGDAEHLLVARTFLGFVGDDARPTRLVGCFALCVPDLESCAKSVERATVTGAFVPPPPPTVPVQAALSLVHHSFFAFTLALVLSLLLGGTLVATRRRPRAK